MCTHRSHRCMQSYMNIMLCCLKCKFLLLYSMERMCRKPDFLQHLEVKKFKWQSQQRRKRLFFFFLLLLCLNLNLILMLCSGKVLLTLVQGHFHCPVTCSFTELCPILGTWQLQGCVTFTNGWPDTQIKEFPVFTSLKSMDLVEQTLCWEEAFTARAKSFGISHSTPQQAQKSLRHHQNLQYNYSNTHNFNIILYLAPTSEFLMGDVMQKIQEI